jgi:hypothetical protein
LELSFPRADCAWSFPILPILIHLAWTSVAGSFLGADAIYPKLAKKAGYGLGKDITKSRGNTGDH